MSASDREAGSRTVATNVTHRPLTCRRPAGAAYPNPEDRVDRENHDIRLNRVEFGKHQNQVEPG